MWMSTYTCSVVGLVVEIPKKEEGSVVGMVVVVSKEEGNENKNRSRDLFVP